MCAGGATAFSVLLWDAQSFYIKKSLSLIPMVGVKFFHIFIVQNKMPVLNPTYLLPCVCVNVLTSQPAHLQLVCIRNIFHLILTMTRYKHLRSTKYQDYL